MRSLNLFNGFALLALTSLVAGAQESATNALLSIRAAQAKQHVNSEAMVTGKIVEVNKAERIVRLNFEKPFPNMPFTAVIFSNKTNLFPEIDKLKDKTVKVRGIITEYRGRPEIILSSTNQLEVITNSGADGEK